MGDLSGSESGKLTQGEIIKITTYINCSLIIQDFATKLIENTKDINPKYAKLANKHFWDLM